MMTRSKITPQRSCYKNHKRKKVRRWTKFALLLLLVLDQLSVYILPNAFDDIWFEGYFILEDAPCTLNTDTYMLVVCR